MKIEEAIERQKQLMEKWESRIAELEDIIIRYPHEKMNYEGADWRPIELERRKRQVEGSKLIVAALEKQIPKEPAVTIQKDDVKIGNGTWKAGTKVHMCMSCFSWVAPYWTYCEKCGQRLR